MRVGNESFFGEINLKELRGDTMRVKCSKLIRRGRNRSGFTLIEMLIVIIILGILAMVIIPQITVSQEDAKISALKTNLAGIRSAIEIYYAQHGNTYPGVVDSGLTGGGANTANAFIWQLTLFSNANGVANNTAGAAYPFGPYVKGGVLPVNPFNNLNSVEANGTQTNIALGRTTNNSVGYVAWLPLGVIFPGTGNATIAAY